MSRLVWTCVGQQPAVVAACITDWAGDERPPPFMTEGGLRLPRGPSEVPIPILGRVPDTEVELGHYAAQALDELRAWADAHPERGREVELHVYYDYRTAAAFAYGLSCRVERDGWWGGPSST